MICGEIVWLEGFAQIDFDMCDSYRLKPRCRTCEKAEEGGEAVEEDREKKVTKRCRQWSHSMRNGFGDEGWME